MFLFRPHREMLADAMAEVKEFATKDDLAKHLTKEHGKMSWHPQHNDIEITTDMINIEAYGFDERIGWDTYIVTVTGLGGVFGFTNALV